MKNSLAPSEAKLDATQARLRARWVAAGHSYSNPVAARKINAMTGSLGAHGGGISTYGGSDLTNTNGDFLGDWRSVDSWMRFDMPRVRARSRQLERGNPWCRSFKISLINNVLGHSGFKWKPQVVTSLLVGDTSEGKDDEHANIVLKSIRLDFERKENFTTRKRLSRKDCDRLLLSRLAFDGEFIVRKIKQFNNDFGFAWQIIDPDYLDSNLNRVEENGNMIKMGVEQDKDYKFPVAYWFLKKRPNDYAYNYAEMHDTLWERVPADEVIHVFMQTDDTEQTRGWPWLFAAAVNLHRLGKYQEAALINAAIGASKMGFFKKTVPDGIVQNPADFGELQDQDAGDIIDEVAPGSWVELPWNVEPVPWDAKYPDAEFDPFNKALLRGIAAALGTSYMSLTGDADDANLSNIRAARDDEREWYMNIQSFLIENWKEPEYKEFIYRGLLGRKIPFPITKIKKFEACSFKGRRWEFTNPVDDMTGKKLELSAFATSITRIIDENGGADRDEVFKELKSDIAALVDDVGIPLEMVIASLFGNGKMDPTGQKKQEEPPKKKDKSDK